MTKKYLQIKRLITYSCLFPDKQPQEFDEYLKTIPTTRAIEFVSHLALTRNQLLKTNDELSLLMPILFRINKDIQHLIVDYLQSIKISEYSFIDSHALLLLTEKLLIYNNPSQDELSRDDYSNIMLAYWICCDERASKVDNVDRIDSPESFLSVYVPEQLIYNDIIYPKDYRTEFIKCFSFMSFCAEDSIFFEYLQIFSTEYRMTWQEYLFINFTLYLKMSTNDAGATPIVYINDTYVSALNFMAPICCELGSFVSRTDFRSLRQTPVLKASNNHFIILSDKFFVDKIFSSLLFDFAKILSKYKQRTNISGFPDLKQLVGQRFTERILFCEIMNRCFSKYADVMLSGETLKSKISNGEPDYYIRKGSRVFIFEFKDVLLNTEVKYSRDLSKIQNEVLELFEESTFEKRTTKSKKSKPKAIKQLLNVIREKLPVIHKEIDKTTLKKIYVFPVIIYTDSNFDVDGVNYMLNERFLSLLSLAELDSCYVVKDLVMINLNNLIQLEDLFFHNKLNLSSCINDYRSFRLANKSDSVISFTKFLMRKSEKQNFKYKNTKWFNDALQVLKNTSF